MEARPGHVGRDAHQAFSEILGFRVQGFGFGVWGIYCGFWGDPFKYLSGMSFYRKLPVLVFTMF